MTENIGGENIMIGGPSVSVSTIRWYRQAIGAKATLYDPRDDSLGVEVAGSPLKLTVVGIARVHALVPISDWYSNSIGVAE